MQGDMSATRLRRAGPANLKIQRPRADSELHFIQVSSCSAAVRHGGPGCSAHPVRRNAMTHFNTSLAQPAKRMLASQPTLFWFKLTRKCQCFPKLSQHRRCMTPTHRSLPHQLSPARDQQQCHGGVLPGIIMSSSTRGNGVSVIQTANLNERRHTQIHKSRSRARILRPRITHSTINFGSAELGPHSAPARSGDSAAPADPPAAATANVC